jgi:hypothetical protein
MRRALESYLRDEYLCLGTGCHALASHVGDLGLLQLWKWPCLGYNILPSYAGLCPKQAINYRGM